MEMMPEKIHKFETLITGLPRSGTSLLLYLFAVNGKDVGYSKKGLIHLRAQLIRTDYDYGRPYPNRYILRGGGEFLADCRKRVRSRNFPQVIKQPYGNDFDPKRILNRYGLEPENVVITNRDMESVVLSQSRTKFHRQYRNPKNILSEAELIEEKLKTVPIRYKELKELYPDAVWIDFPKFVTDFDYLWDTVGHLLNQGGKAQMYKEFCKIADIDLVRF